MLMKAFCHWTRSTCELAEMTLLMLDTNIISDMMRNAQGPAARRVIEITADNPLALFRTSVIVDCELRYGLARKPQARLLAAYERTMAILMVLPLEPDAAAIYALLRQRLTASGIGLDANDTLIAAHALTVNATLVSADAAFARVPGLQVENWLSEAV